MELSDILKMEDDEFEQWIKEESIKSEEEELKRMLNGFSTSICKSSTLKKEDLMNGYAVINTPLSNLLNSQTVYVTVDELRYLRERAKIKNNELK
jgi:hypothetical protein